MCESSIIYLYISVHNLTFELLVLKYIKELYTSVVKSVKTTKNTPRT